MASLVCDKASTFISDKLVNLILKSKDEACNNPTALADKLFGEMKSSMLFPGKVREALEANRALLDTALQQLSTDPGFIEVCAMMKDPAKAGQFEATLRNQIQSKTKMLISQIPVCVAGAPAAAATPSAAPAAGGRRRNRRNRKTRQNRKNRKNRRNQTKRR